MIAAMRRRDERFGAQAMLAARFGIDLRMPFSDRNLVDLAFLIPDDQKVGPSGGKLILRQAAALMLPGRIAERPKRVQQLRYDQAMQSWLTKMFDRLLPTDGDRARGIYDRHGLKVMREHLADALTAETFRPAWNALSIEIWMRLFHDEDRFTRIETGQSTPSGEIA
jgi:asparagine synthase (glutamine-hydrolysing)